MFLVSINSIQCQKTQDQTVRFQSFMDSLKGLPINNLFYRGFAHKDAKEAKKKLISYACGVLVEKYSGPASGIDWENVGISFLVTEIQPDGSFSLPPGGNNGGLHWLDKDDPSY